MPDLVSVLIPARNEPYLQQTIHDVLAKAVGPVEVVVTLDGYWPNPPLAADARVTLIHRTKPLGMRAALNSAAQAARGRYLLKLDAHCLLAMGWDEELKRAHQPQWVQIPRRLRLDPDRWTLTDAHKRPVDYERLTYPADDRDGVRGRVWEERAVERAGVMIDETPTMQGSCYFLRRSYWDMLELLDADNWGSFRLEAQEISLKVWLSGGAVMVNKHTSYAHWHKPKSHGRGYRLDTDDQQQALDYSRRFLSGRPWHKQTRDLLWLIQHFQMPGWP